MDENNKKSSELKDLTDKDFYQQACAYFYYHAEQRTTMINFFIAVFAACIALYGSLISDYSLASTLIAVFLFIVSVLFYFIDLRNRFDVKESQNVIEQIERDYRMDSPDNNSGRYAYGVFSNEANVFKLYGLKKRSKEYKELKKLNQKLKRMDKLSPKYKDLKTTLDKKIKVFLKKNNSVSEHELIESFKSKSIITLSFSIKMLYFMCMLISFLAFVLALLITLKIL